jgi:iron complex outermembrane receptor protein
MVLPVTPILAQDSAAETAESGDIIVTARRRDEALQDTPVAITAVNAAMLENKAATDIGSLMGTAPSLLITRQSSGGSAANLSIRGMSYADVEKSQEPAVGVVVDGVFIGTNTGQLLDAFDVEQIEVLRGPQGTLFGRNTIGGVISVRRTRPTMEFGGKIDATYSSFNSWQTRAVVNVGDGENFGVKGWYFHNESDGFYRNGITGERAGASNNDSFGGALLIKPEGSGFDALLTVEKLNQRFDPVTSNISRTGELFCLLIPANQCNRDPISDIYTTFNSPAISIYKSPSATLEMNYDTGGVKITSVTGWRKSKEYQTQDFDSSTLDLFYTLRLQDYKQFSQELRFSGNIGSSIDYVVGGFYFDSSYDLVQHTRRNNPTADPQVVDPNPRETVASNESYAFFGDFNISLSETLRLSVGGRWTHDKKALTTGFRVTGSVGDGVASFSKFTPKIGVDWRPNDDTMLYAGWSRGYRSGGFSPRAATVATASAAYGPETVDSFEIGTKLDLADRRIQLNIAAYYSDYKDLQQNTTIPGGPNGNQTITSNVGKATIKGLEIDFAAKVTDDFRITGAIGLTDSKFNEFLAGNSISGARSVFIGTVPAGAAAIIAAGGANLAAYNATPTLLDYSGNRLIYAPKVTAALGAEYTADLGGAEMVLNLGYRYISAYDQQISLGPISGTLPNAAIVGGALVVTQPSTPLVVNGNDPRVRSDRQGLLDASATVRFDLGGMKAKATVWGRNLADDRGPTSAFTVAGLFSFSTAREPRAFGATVGFEF